jgi:hypothetical protein
LDAIARFLALLCRFVWTMGRPMDSARPHPRHVWPRGHRQSLSAKLTEQRQATRCTAAAVEIGLKGIGVRELRGEVGVLDSKSVGGRQPGPLGSYSLGGKSSERGVGRWSWPLCVRGVLTPRSREATMSTEATLAHHLKSLKDGDLEAIMLDYRDDSVLITPDGPLHGLAEIRKLFSKIVTVMLPPGSEFELLRQEIAGEVAYTVWRGTSPNFNFLLGTDTFIIRDDAIACQTFAAQIQPKGLYKTQRPPPP